MATLAGFSKEVYELAEEKIPGGKLLAPAALFVVVLAIIAGSGKYLYDVLLRPVAATVGNYQGGFVGWLPFVVLVGVFLVCAAFGWLLIRRRLSQIEGQIRWVRAHGKLLEARKAADEDLEKLKGRVAKLELHTDIDGSVAALVERGRRQADLERRRSVQTTEE